MNEWMNECHENLGRGERKKWRISSNFNKSNGHTCYYVNFFNDNIYY